MENKIYTIISDFVSNSDTITTTTTTTPVNTTTNSNTFTSLTSIDNPTTPSLETLQSVPPTPVDVYADHNNGSNRIITQPIFNKLLSDIIKNEQLEDNSKEKYSSTKTKASTNPENSDHTQQQTSEITLIRHNPRETIHNLSEMSMANIGGQLISNLNVSHLPNGNGQYLLSGLHNDLTSNHKLSIQSNANLPSPSTSSNSSNPSSFQQGKRHGEGNDPNRKREVRLQKNRDAARECRRKKKEYIKCLEERVTGLEKQNKALIEELRQLKELYCQREETKLTTNTR